MENKHNQPIVLFDGICKLCNASVNFIIRRDPRGIFHFASLQSDFGRSKIINCPASQSGSDSIVLIIGEKCFTKSSAALRIARRLQFPWPLFYAFIIIPKSFRDWIYDIIAENRYRWFGKLDTIRSPTEDEKTRFLE